MPRARVPAEVVAALADGRRNGNWIRANCPWCSTTRSDRPLAAAVDDPSSWHCFRCHREEEFKDGERRGRQDNARKLELRDDAEKRKATALELWEQAVPVRTGDPVDLYLRGRQLVPPNDSLTWPDALRLHARLWHPHDRCEHPAMVAQVVSASGMPTAVHRTYLTHDGRKALLRPAKMSLGPIRGCAIRLAPGNRVIVAEGIESALGAAMVHRDLAPWSAISAGGIETLAIPRDLQRIVCARDRGKAGRRAANILRERVEQAEYEQHRLIGYAVYTPAFKADDFADFERDE